MSFSHVEEHGRVRPRRAAGMWDCQVDETTVVCLDQIPGNSTDHITRGTWPVGLAGTAEVCLQACSPKQVMQDVAHAEGRRLRTQADSDQHWHHLLSPQPPTDPPSHGRGVNGGTSASCIAPGRGPEGAGGEGLPEDQGSAAGGRRRPSGWKAHAVKVAPRRELSPPRRTATPQPLPQALIEVASRHSGFATTMRAAGAAPGAGVPAVLQIQPWLSLQYPVAMACSLLGSWAGAGGRWEVIWEGQERHACSRLRGCLLHLQ